MQTTLLTFESPIIAWSVCHELKKTLFRLTEAGVPISKNALVLGFGAIGKAVANELKGLGWNVAVYDPLAERVQDAADQSIKFN